MSVEKKTKIFLSYSRKDKPFVRKLKESIDQTGFDVWVDWEGIPLSADWMAEITQAIESADAFLFVISPDSLKSEICDRELELAVKGNKKIIPILYREVEKKQPIHPKLASTNWVYMRSRKEKFEKSLPLLVDSIQTDLGWVKQHTRLFQRASEWTQKSNSIYLLQGSDLEEAERWMMEATMTEGREVTPVQAEYIRESRKNATRRQRNFTIGVGMVTAFSIILGIVAVAQWFKAEDNAKLAQISADKAIASEQIALTQQALAEENAQIALENENRAKAQKSAAQANTYKERPGELDISTLLALESLSRTQSGEAQDVLRDNLSRMPIPIAQSGQNDRIWNIQVSMDGQSVITSSADGTACVWQMNGEKQFCVQHQKDVTNALLTDDNRLLITSSKDNTVGVWNGSDGSLIQTYEYPTEILDIALSPNNKLVLVGRQDGYLSVINLDKSRDVFAFNFLAGPISVVKFHPKGEWAGIATKTGNIRLWRVFTNQLEYGPRHESEIFNFEFSPDGKIIVSASEDSTARIARAETGRQTHVIIHHDWVEDVDISPDGTWFATVSDDKLVRVFDSATGVEKTRMAHGSFAQKVKVSPNGNWIASTGYDLTARIWDSHSGALMLEASLEGIGSALKFSPDGNTVVIGDRNGNLTFWDISSLHARVNYIVFTEYINKAKFDPAGNWILVNTDDRILWQIATDQITTLRDGTLAKNILSFDELTAQMKVSPDSQWIAISQNSEVNNSLAILYNLETGVKHLLPHSSDISGLAISADGNFLATTNEGNSALYIWEVETGTQVNNLQFNETAFTSSYSPRDALLAIGLTDKTILWDTQTNSETATLRQVGRITSITFNHDGSWLATTSSDGSLFIWDMSSPDLSEPRYKFLQGGRVTSLDFNPHKNWLASASANGFVHLWDLDTGQEIIRIPHGDLVSGIQFSPDGKLLSSVSRKILQLWDVNMLVPIVSDELVEVACSRLTRNLAPSEWEFFFSQDPYRLLCSNLP
ncbi:MAG: TIR domain-containing protein [Anaerolineales bacterium]|nr:TIR domain-containing protein [Anaerolineales bacterium]